jgi:23S rRNA pseudouridine2605 synthase
MRLNAYLARAGVASRRGAEELIRAGRVRVNGEVGGLATFVEGNDMVEVDGSPVEPEPLTYVLLHKPAGVVTTARDPQGRPTVVGLVGHDRRVVPVGRLDADTTGVLLLTNDGPLAHRLMHPRYEVHKVYEAEVEGEPSEHALARLREGVELEDGLTAPAAAEVVGASRVELTIHEGRKHQVKRMLEAVGHPVRRLHRKAYAGLTLDGLEPGEWRELSSDEVKRLRAPRAPEPVGHPRRNDVLDDDEACQAIPEGSPGGVDELPELSREHDGRDREGDGTPEGLLAGEVVRIAAAGEAVRVDDGEEEHE